MVRAGVTVTVRNTTVAVKTEGSKEKSSLMFYHKTPTEELGLDWNGSNEGGEASFFRKTEHGEVSMDFKVLFEEIDYYWKTVQSWFTGKTKCDGEITCAMPIGEAPCAMPIEEGNAVAAAETPPDLPRSVPLHRIQQPWTILKTE